jgi:hypothetical protein
MNLTNIDLSKMHATVHMVYTDWDSLEDAPCDNIFSFPSRVLEIQNNKVVVEELTDDPRRFTFYLHQSPNGMKEWSVKADELNGADDIRLSLIHEDE